MTGNVEITPREVYDQVLEMRGEISTFIAEQRSFNTTSITVRDDHERRIRVGERWQWAIPPALLGVLLNVALVLGKVTT